MAASTSLEPNISTTTLWIDPFNITETTFEATSQISAESCRQKIEALDKVRCQPKKGYNVDAEVLASCKTLKPSEGLTCNCKIQVKYPQFASEEYDNKNLDKLNVELKNLAQSFINKYFPNIINCDPSILKTEINLVYHLEYDGKYKANDQLYQTDKMLTVKYDVASNFDANPMTYSKFLNFELASGKLLTIEDVIDKKLLTQFYDWVWTVLVNNSKSYYYNDQAKSYKEAQTKYNKAPFAIKNFYFGKSQVFVYFNPSEVGPRTFGDVILQVDKRYLNKKYSN